MWEQGCGRSHPAGRNLALVVAAGRGLAQRLESAPCAPHVRAAAFPGPIASRDAGRDAVSEGAGVPAGRRPSAAAPLRRATGCTARQWLVALRSPRIERKESVWEQGGLLHGGGR